VPLGRVRCRFPWLTPMMNARLLPRGPASCSPLSRLPVAGQIGAHSVARRLRRQRALPKDGTVPAPNWNNRTHPTRYHEAR
jgi:hypothetical protein